MHEPPLDYFEAKLNSRIDWLAALNKVNYIIFPILHLFVVNYIKVESAVWTLILIVPMYIVLMTIVFLAVLVFCSLFSVVLEFLGLIDQNLFKQALDFRKWIIIFSFIANIGFVFFMYFLIHYVGSSPF